MAGYNVYLGQIGNSRNLTNEVKSTIQITLVDWFRQIVEGTDYTANVVWTQSAPSIQGHELLVYFVPSNLESVAIHMPGAPNVIGEQHGMTLMSGSGDQGLTCSEIYTHVAGGTGQNFARIAFHELMHNKLHLNNQQLHARNGLAASPIPAGAEPTLQNIAQMRAALPNIHPQWTGGFEIGDF